MRVVCASQSHDRQRAASVALDAAALPQGLEGWQYDECNSDCRHALLMVNIQLRWHVIAPHHSPATGQVLKSHPVPSQGQHSAAQCRALVACQVNLFEALVIADRSYPPMLLETPQECKEGRRLTTQTRHVRKQEAA
ncbi:hypothetical protein HBH56_003650 [Parastagonospora nodorum]|uniref:Uncharacterized protein n=1 Tax=Phaeosphaeria nodorum (strain SN15 / ATCC MYA-4574 / FGSC 10173) TaxID=321614 RepID=A0A7U2HU10_PHANO|nr:hypothetical protein HBH56_003650 [Parastagonospora nodorum]QRC90284.1 hypothetical protein JI435_306740 [Parastagonospora nodorum SN15]KAH3937967.1 hypothetical protein HBH54_003640 [Parastagonospora nodorum]KAH3946640.1 hypothetical protein HBH53_128350 [Parastagonospora nodorum]KAH3975034.1 hypothetical protein HBH51_086410 [Parastagonospora nodorum]